MQVALPTQPVDLSQWQLPGQETAPPLTPEELDSAGTQFEGVFMSLLIKELRESLESGMFAGENSDTYGALFDLYLGQHMAASGGLGIKQMLVSRYAEAGKGA